MLERMFRIRENNTTVSREIAAGLTTFLTMAYIIFLQPQILSGKLFGQETGLDFGAVLVATCVSAAVSTLIMGLWANFPIALAPGMGENFFFVLALIPAAASVPAVQAGHTTAWQVALGVIFVSGVLFLLISLLGAREKLLEAISPSMRSGIAVGIGLFIALIGLRNAGLVLVDESTGLKLNPQFASPDLVVFFFGVLVTAACHARRIRGSILIGIFSATVFAALLKEALLVAPEAIRDATLVRQSRLMAPEGFVLCSRLVSQPPSASPTLLRMDILHALSTTMLPFIFIFLFMDLFDTLGTLVGVCEQAGLIRNGKLPRAARALTADAVGTVVGACLGTSTVTSYIESAAGVEQGGRTGLTAVTVAILFLAALFFGPVIEMVGNYPPVTAPALVVVGTLMMRNVVKIDWGNYAEVLPSFLIAAGIPFTYSIGDGLALGFIAYPIVKLFAGQGSQVHWLMYVTALVLLAYLVLVRSAVLSQM